MLKVTAQASFGDGTPERLRSPLAELDAWRPDSYEGDDDYDTVLLGYSESGAADRLDRPEDDRRARLEFATSFCGEAQAWWRLEIEGCLESLWSGGAGDPWWHDDHVLLAPYQDRGGWISFSRSFVDPLRALGAATKAHRVLAEDWIPLGRFFRTEMLYHPFGILAEGPERFMAAYATALKDAGEDVAVAFPGGKSKSDERPSPSVVTWGESYFVARTFRLERTG